MWLCLILFSTILILIYLIPGFHCEVDKTCPLLGYFSYTMGNIAEKHWSYINVLVIICSWLTSTRMQSDIEHTKPGYSKKFLFQLTVFYQTIWWDRYKCFSRTCCLCVTDLWNSMVSHPRKLCLCSDHP
jgi:hypothetical protein